MSIFAGGFTLAAAEAVCATDGISLHAVADLLSSLVDKSLVNVTLVEDVARYAMLESVRSFALDRLSDAGQIAVFSQRHAEWVAAFADRLDAIRAELSETHMFAEVNPELENARTALTWALATNSEQGALLAGRIVGGLRMLWIPYGQLAECARWAKAALERIDEERYPMIVARLLRALVQTTPPDEALVWSARAIPLYERTGDLISLAVMHYMSSREYRLRGLLKEADAAHARASELLESNLPSQFQVALLTERVWLRIEQGRYEEALDVISEGTAMANALGDFEAFRWANYHAELEFAKGRTEAAIRVAEDVAERVRHSGADQSFWAGGVYASIACFRAASGDLQGGYTAARESLLLARSGQRPTASEPLMAMAFIASGTDPSRSARLLGAIEMWERSRIVSDPESITKGGGGVVRQLLIASLKQRLAQRELERLKTEGASYSWDFAIEEALKIEKPTEPTQ